jgi:hypothetical protein
MHRRPPLVVKEGSGTVTIEVNATGEPPAIWPESDVLLTQHEKEFLRFETAFMRSGVHDLVSKTSQFLILLDVAWRQREWSQRSYGRRKIDRIKCPLICEIEITTRFPKF